MRRKDKEVTSRAWMLDVLREGLYAEVAFAGEEGPYVVPVNYGFEDGRFIFHGAPEGKKFELLRADPRVRVHEGLNLRYMAPEDIGGPAELTVCDVSFISLTLVIAPLAAATATPWGATPRAPSLISIKRRYSSPSSNVL